MTCGCENPPKNETKICSPKTKLPGQSRTLSDLASLPAVPAQQASFGYIHPSFPPPIMKSSQFSGEEDPERTNVTARDREINTFRVREWYAPCSSVNYQTKILSREGKERI